MEQHVLTAEQAFAVMRHSHENNRKPHLVGADVVAGRASGAFVRQLGHGEEG